MTNRQSEWSFMAEQGSTALFMLMLRQTTSKNRRRQVREALSYSILPEEV